MSLTGNGLDTQAPTMTVPIATSDDPAVKDMALQQQLEVAHNAIFLLVQHAGGTVRISSRQLDDYFRGLEGQQLVQYRSPINDDWVCELKKLTPISQS